MPVVSRGHGCASFVGCVRTAGRTGNEGCDEFGESFERAEDAAGTFDGGPSFAVRATEEFGRLRTGDAGTGGWDKRAAVRETDCGARTRRFFTEYRGGPRCVHSVRPVYTRVR